MDFDLGLSFDEDDYEKVATAEDAEIFQQKQYEHTFDGVCELCERRHFPGLNTPAVFQKQLRKHLSGLPVEEAQRFIDQMDEVAAWYMPAQISALAIEEESHRADGQEITAFIRSMAETLDEITGGAFTNKLTVAILERKIIAMHEAIEDLDKIERDLLDNRVEEDSSISFRIRELLDFSRGVRNKRLDNLANMYRDTCKDKGLEPNEHVIKEGKFETGSNISQIMELLNGKDTL